MSASASSSPGSTPPPPGGLPDVTARLRAAGCVFAEDEARLLMATARTPAEVDEMVARRAAGLPLEHVLGWAEFCGLRIAVEPGVFVPRRRTEFLAGQAVALAREGTLAREGASAGSEATVLPDTVPPDTVPPDTVPPDTVLADTVLADTVLVDLCCGSGAVGAAVATVLHADAGARRVELHAADIDPAAVACARRNVAAVGGAVYLGDLYEPLPASLRGRVALLTANVPYIPAGAIDTLPAEARVHEPRVALDGGADGLEILRRVAADAPRWLAPGGHLLVETSEEQARSARQAFAGAGLIPRVVASEDLDATVIIGTRPA
jgi:release factor glutamine methyltransferase